MSKNKNVRNGKHVNLEELEYIHEPRKARPNGLGIRHGNPISAGQLMRLTGLLLRSSLSFEAQDEMMSQLDSMRPYDVPDLVEYLEMNQLDLTQLNNYSKDDIDRRLDRIDVQEKM